MAVFVSMQITLIVMFLLICINDADNSSASLSNDEFLQGVIAIKQKSTYKYHVRKPSEYVLQNIGRVNVIVANSKFVTRDELAPCQEMKLNFTLNCDEVGSTWFVIFNPDSNKRAIVYISNLKNDNIEESGQEYDKIKVLEETLTLGVRNITEECETIQTLISYFWPADKDNVWKQIFDVIKNLLEEDEQQETSRWIESDIKILKDNLDRLHNKTTGEKYYALNKLYDDIENVLNLKNIVVPTRFTNITMFHFYTLPLFCNFLTLRMYFVRFGVGDFHIFHRDLLWRNNLDHLAFDTVEYQLSDAITYINKIEDMVNDKIYNTVNVPDLYNVMMNARNYLVFHGSELIVIWKQIHYKITLDYPFYYDLRLDAISYSNYYGRASPNLLQQAIHIYDSILYAHSNGSYAEALKLNSIDFSITEGTVCGLKLNFSHNVSFTMGTFEVGNDQNVSTLHLSNRKIFQLKVYKTKFIRCLNFTLSDRNTRMYGDCQDNSEEYEEFKLEGHYIYSLYLANDYTETDSFFDNVAVSYYPNPVEVF